LDLPSREKGAEERAFYKLLQAKPCRMRTNFYAEMMHPSMNLERALASKRRALRLAWPTVDKPRTVAVRKGGPGGVGSCWEGEGCGLSSDGNHNLF